MASDRKRRNTDRFRPDVADGASDDGLSLPRHAPHSDMAACPKQQVNPAAIPEPMDVIIDIGTDMSKPFRRKGKREKKVHAPVGIRFCSCREKREENTCPRN